uniref:Cytochrome P450 6A1 n=1 Tax=Cacopsylla melanoneura TaxID=428564 RepID=A0A8D8X3M3_9HEMI
MFYFFSSVFNCLSLIFIVLLLLLIRVYFWTVDSYKFFKNLGLPYEEPKFLIGNLRNYPLISKNKHQFYFVEEIYKKHADKTYVGFFKFRKPMLMIRDPIICQQVFTTYFEHFCNRPGPPVDPKKDPLSNHLINMQGKQWKSVRTKLSPAFTPSKLKDMFQDMHECCLELINLIDSKISIDNEIEVIHLMAQFSLRASGKCILGLDSDVLNNPVSQFNTICKTLFTPTTTAKAKQIFQFLFPQYYSKYLEIKNISYETFTFLHSIMREAFESRGITTNKKRNDFLKLVADIHRTELSFDTNDPTSEANKDYITESIIMSNTFLFLTTGYESTATTTASVLYELALNEDVQEKVRQEVRDHIGQWSYSSIASLKYLDQVICESQRLHPVNTSLSRQCTSDQFKLPGTDVYIPRGTHVCIPTFAMYKDPKFFSNPDRFNPENFSKENTKQLKILCPFGEGPRQCIAKSYSLIEVKLAIAHLILKFKFKRCSKTDVPLQYIPEKLFITPANGIWIGFEKILS